MSICIISHYPPIEGGISKYTERTVTLFKEENIEVSIVPVENLLSSFHILPRILKIKPDIIRFEYAISMYRLTALIIFLQLLIIKILKISKIIVNFHEVSRDTSCLGIFGIFFYSSIRNLFDYVTVHTNQAKQILIKRCHYPSETVMVIPHGLYLSKSKAVNALKHPKKKRVILFFGYIHVHKGIEYLLEAYKSFLEKNSVHKETTQLMIAGSIRKRKGIFTAFEIIDKNYSNQLLSKTKSLKIEKNTSFLGYIKENDIEDLFNNAYIFVLPYISTEQSGVLNKVLPYEKPIIASDIGGLSETLKNVGILVKPKIVKDLADAMTKLIQNDNFYEEVKENYAILNKSLDPKKLTRKTLALYQQISNF